MADTRWNSEINNETIHHLVLNAARAAVWTVPEDDLVAQATRPEAEFAAISSSAYAPIKMLTKYIVIERFRRQMGQARADWFADETHDAMTVVLGG